MDFIVLWKTTANPSSKHGKQGQGRSGNKMSSQILIYNIGKDKVALLLTLTTFVEHANAILFPRVSSN